MGPRLHREWVVSSRPVRLIATTASRLRSQRSRRRRFGDRSIAFSLIQTEQTPAHSIADEAKTDIRNEIVKLLLLYAFIISAVQPVTIELMESLPRANRYLDLDAHSVVSARSGWHTTVGSLVWNLALFCKGESGKLTFLGDGKKGTAAAPEAPRAARLGASLQPRPARACTGAQNGLIRLPGPTISR